MVTLDTFLCVQRRMAGLEAPDQDLVAGDSIRGVVRSGMVRQRGMKRWLRARVCIGERRWGLGGPRVEVVVVICYRGAGVCGVAKARRVGL